MGRSRGRQTFREGARTAIAVGVTVGLTSVGLGTLPARAATRLPSMMMSSRLRRRAGKLSPRLSLLADGASFASPRVEAASLALPVDGPGSLVREAGGRLLVEIRVASTAATSVAGLVKLGATVVNVSPAYSAVTASVTPSMLTALAEDTSVVSVTEVLAPVTAGDSAGGAPGGVARVASCHPTISEGDTLMNVAAARSANNLDGAGQTIGILSDSFNTDTTAATHAAGDIASGDLPGPGNPCGQTSPVTVQSEYSAGGQTDEGRAMAELAHGLAPGAHLAFASAANGEFDYANQINTLRTINHASVIVDDTSYLDEPFFQDGPVATAANAASAAGVPYFSAAGNDNVIVDGNNVSSYETPQYRPTTCPPEVLSVEPGFLSCHNFDATGGNDNTDDITLAPGGGFGLDLQWAEPWELVRNDYDVFLFDTNGNPLAGSAFDQSQFREPFEFFGYTNTTGAPQTVRLVIVKFAGGVDSRMKFVFLGASGITSVQYDTSTGGDIVGPSIFGHDGASSVGTTSAIPYDNSSASEPYSSRGPVTHYYEPTPGTTALASPEVIDKPNFAATDNVRSVFLGDVIGGVRRFPGTSASAAQAAAIGALLKERDPALSPAQVMTTLSSTARAVATDGDPTEVGGGYLDATAALASVVPIPGPPTAATASNGDTETTVNWSAAPTNPNFPVSSYLINPSKDGVAQAPIATGTASTSALVTGLTNLSSYTFTVAATDANGTGPPSDPTAAIVVGLPDPPSAVTETSGDGQAQVSWMPPPASNITITGYQVTPIFNNVALAPQSFSGTATTQTVTGLTNGDFYSFEVAAVDALGAGPPAISSAGLYVGTPGPPPAPAVGYDGMYDGTKVSVTWSLPAADNGSPVYGEDVAWFNQGNLVSSLFFPSTITSTEISNLVKGTTYTFAVAAWNARGLGVRGPASRAVTPGTPISLQPPTPTVSGNGAAILTWHPPAKGPAASSGYSLRAYNNGDLITTQHFPSTAAKGTLTGLSNGTTYRFTVAGANQFGAGWESALSDPLTVGLPTAPQIISALPGNANALLRWRASSGNGTAVTKYVVTPYIGGHAQPATIFNSTGTTQRLTGLTNARTYTFEVAAINGNGTGPRSPASDPVRVGAPRAPTAVSAAAGSRGAVVRWHAPANDGAAITGYTITPYIGGHPQPAHTFHTPATTDEIDGLQPGRLYTFRVAATNSRGTGPQSTDSNHIRVG